MSLVKKVLHVSLHSTNIPRTVTKALMDAKWEHAIKWNMDKCVISKNKIKNIGHRWVFTVKY